MGFGRITLAKVEGVWTRMLIGGVMTLDACFYCCKQFLFGSNPSCGGDATCNLFCDSRYAAFSRAECCQCPCPGRRDYPQCFGWKVFGATLSTDPIPDYQNPGYYWKLLSSAAVPEVTDCDGDDVTFDGVTWGYYAPDGTLIDSPPGSVRVETGFSVDTDSDALPPNGTVSANVLIDADPGGGRGFNIQFVGGIGTSDSDVVLPACTGGSATGTSDWLTWDSEAEDRNPGVGANPPTILVFPKCANCDGSPCQTGSTPASRCANPTFEANVQIGTDPETGEPIYEPVSIPLFKSPDGCHFSGGNGTVSVTIAPDSDCIAADEDGNGLLHWVTTVTSPAGSDTISIDPGAPTGYLTACPYLSDADSAGILVTDANLVYGDDCED